MRNYLKQSNVNFKTNVNILSKGINTISLLNQSVKVKLETD